MCHFLKSIRGQVAYIIAFIPESSCVYVLRIGMFLYNQGTVVNISKLIMDSTHISIWSADPKVSPSISRSSQGWGVVFCFPASTALNLDHFLNTFCLCYDSHTLGKCSFLPSGVKFHFGFVLMIPSGFSLLCHSPPFSELWGSLPGTWQAVWEDTVRLDRHLVLASVSARTWCLGVFCLWCCMWCPSSCRSSTETSCHDKHPRPPLAPLLIVCTHSSIPAFQWLLITVFSVVRAQIVPDVTVGIPSAGCRVLWHAWN